MKKLITLLVLVLFVVTVQSQSLTNKDITGTWQVVNIENSNSNPKLAKMLNNAILNFNDDKSFELKERQEIGAASTFNTTSQKSSQWSYNENTQTISTTSTKMTFRVTQSNNKLYFVDKGSGLKIEVVKPI